MASLRERLDAAERALAKLEELARLDEPAEVQRDAAIQRFEYTVEAVWKAARHLLLEREGLDRASPKSVVRASMEVGLLSMDDAAAALSMIDDRNLTSHTYNEALAASIYARLGGHAQLLARWLASMKDATSS